MENYRPGVMDKLGLGYDQLKEVNDRIIYAAVSGFGCYGPNSQRPGYDIIAQAVGGLMSISGHPGGEPTRVGSAMGDILGGMNLTIGILMALHARSLTGRGQRVDVALVDSVVASLETGTQRYDGNFVIACGNDHLFQLLCEKVIDRPDLLTDPRFDSNIKRCDNHAALKPEIEVWTRQHTIDEAVDAINAAGVPAAPINDMRRVTSDDSIVNVRQMFVPLHHPVIGDMRVNGNPVKLLDMMPEINRCAPELGQDNQAVYGELLGLDEAALQEYKDKRVI